MNNEIFIMACPNCGVKNRIKSYSADRLPVCAKCRTPLVDEDKNEAHAKFSKNVEEFYNLPGFGARPKE